jgi:hypothetical protein
VTQNSDVRRILLVLVASACFAAESTADKLIEAGHWKRARWLVEQRLHEAPDDPEANFLWSQIRNAFGDHASPPGFAEKAVRLDGRVARYHRQLAEVQGTMAMHSGVFQQVMLARRFRKEIDAALALDPRDLQALRDLMEFYLLAPGLLGGDSKKAETVAHRIAGIDAAQGFLAKARIAELGKDPARTEAMLRLAADVRPVSYNALLALAQFYLAPEHRNDAAAEALGKRALAVGSGRIAAYSVLATVAAGRADWNALDAILSAATREVPDDATPYYRAAERILSDNRDPARAERYLRLYLAQEAEGNQPTHADAHWKLGLALRAQGQDARELKRAVNASAGSGESPIIAREPN